MFHYCMLVSYRIGCKLFSIGSGGSFSRGGGLYLDSSPSTFPIDLPGKKELKNLKKCLMSHGNLELVEALIQKFKTLLCLTSTQHRLSDSV